MHEATGILIQTSVKNHIGTITLNANLANYLASGIAVTGSSASLRFRPAYFDTAVTPGCGSFTYSGQPFTVKATANRVGGGTTVNYDGGAGYATSFATTLSNAGVTTGFTNNTLATTDFSAGVGSKGNVTYTYASRLTAPTPLALRAIDADTVSSSGHSEATATIYSGRARLLNGNGSELLDLPMTLRSEYWQDAAHGWQFNAADTCTGNGTPAANAVSISIAAGTLAASKTCVWDGGSPGNSGAGCSSLPPLANRKFLEGGVSGTDSNGVAGFAGNFNLWLRAPGTTNTGNVSVTANVPTWLQFPWTSGTATNPAGLATFGVFRSGPVIHRREMY
jgi:MSHA biogenesis protein MshQ